MKTIIAVCIIAGTIAIPYASHAGIVIEANIVDVGLTNGQYDNHVTGPEFGVGYDFNSANWRVTPIIGGILDDDQTSAYVKLEAAYKITENLDLGLGVRSSEDDTSPYFAGGTRFIRGFVGKDYYGIGLRFGF